MASAVPTLQWDPVGGWKVSALSYTSDGALLAAVSSDGGMLSIYRSSDGEMLASIEGKDAGWSALFMHLMLKMGWQGGISCSRDTVAVASRCQNGDGSGEFDRCVKILSLPSLDEVATIELPLAAASAR